jgi:hypothetical protein
MSSALFTLSGLYAIVFHKNNLWILGTSFVLAIVSLVWAFVSEWRNEHNKLLKEVEKRKRDHDTYGNTMKELRSRLEYEINSNRPEVFAEYAKDLIFDEVEGDSWDPGLWLECPEGILLSNTGRTIAYNVSLDPVTTDEFSLYFPPVLRIGINESSYVLAYMQPSSNVDFTDRSSIRIKEQNGTDGDAFYEINDAPGGKRITIHPGLRLRVEWRDSSGNHFFSTSKNCEFSAIERMKPPLKEEDKQAAYEDEEIE